MNDTLDLIFLTKRQARKSAILKKYGLRAAITDFGILLGGKVFDNYIPEGYDLDQRACDWWLATHDFEGDVKTVHNSGSIWGRSSKNREISARPVAKIPDISINQWANRFLRNKDGIMEFSYGEYPQMIADKSTFSHLEHEFKSHSLEPTGHSYITDSRLDDSSEFFPKEHIEYEYNGKKYVRFVYLGDKTLKLSDGRNVEERAAVWLEVQPIKWYFDEKLKMIISKKCLFAGIQYSIHHKERFKFTNIKDFMNKHFMKNIFKGKTDIDPDILKQSEELSQNAESNIEKVSSEKQNPYNFDFSSVTEEEIIKGTVLSNVSVFLHGLSSEGKTSRVEQLDPDLEVIYLKNQTIDSLNGKSVYSEKTQEMIDIAPTWYKRVKEKCEKEPDKIHVVFFDEITNALPAIQSMAFDIVLKKVVNGIWELPPNCRVIAAGNDMKDSVAAHQLAEPLFNRFAHVYITTNVDSWLRWALTVDNKFENLDYEEFTPPHKIHPAIYSFIAYKGEAALRSPFTGDKPNADPRKWELASRLLYKTNKPEMIRALVGEELTRDFIEFCCQKVITLQDVIDGKYNELDLDLDTAQKWATVMALAYVDEDNIEKVRGFVLQLEPELVSLFDSLWSYGNESRMEKITELRMMEGSKKR